MRYERSSDAFSLLELLIVVAVIVVLLGVFAPSIVEVTFSASKAGCESNQRAAVSGFTNYAADHGRRFPTRDPHPSGVHADWNLHALSPGYIGIQQYNPNRTQTIPAADLRPMIARYIAINEKLNDPLTEPIDLEDAVQEVWLYGSYYMFAGWRYPDPNFGGPGMLKLGDRFTWDGKRYSVMTSDADHYRIRDTYAESSHPDHIGLLINKVVRADGSISKGTVPPTIGGSTYSWWDNYSGGSGGEGRGTIDKNVAYSDGSVTRFPGVAYPTEGLDRVVFDPRMDSVPLNQESDGTNGYWPTNGVQIPKM